MREKLLKILDDKKVEDVAVYDLRMKSALFDFFIIGTVVSPKQVYAIYDDIKKSGINIHHVEETSDGDWTLIDCFDIVVHLFSEQKREEYDLDSLCREMERKRGNGYQRTS